LPIVVPVVEGHGEVEAVPVLLRRMLEREQRFDIEIGRPFRVKRHRVVKAGELERSLTLAIRSRSADAVIVLLDSDDDCPVDLAGSLLARVNGTAFENVSVVCACREFEAWFLAAKRSLRGKCEIGSEAECIPEAENLRDAKGRITANMDGDRRYLEVDDQPRLAAALDLDLAEERARSFRKMCDELRKILDAIDAGEA
jgi:hypothetical protein